MFDLSILGIGSLIGKYRTIDDGGLCIGCTCIPELSDLAKLIIRFPRISVGFPMKGMSMRIRSFLQDYP